MYKFPAGKSFDAARNFRNESIRATSPLSSLKGRARQSVSFLYTLRKYKFLAGCRFDVARNFRNKV